MIDKIYEKIRKEQNENYRKYEFIPIDGKEFDESRIIECINVDFENILKYVGLIDEYDDKLEEIRDIYEYIYKLGLDIGIGNGKRIMMENMKRDKLSIKQLMEINPEEITQIEYCRFTKKELKEMMK